MVSSKYFGKEYSERREKQQDRPSCQGVWWGAAKAPCECLASKFGELMQIQKSEVQSDQPAPWRETPPTA